MPPKPIERRTRTVQRRVEITEHRCQYCGTWFEARRADARYCPQPAGCRVYAHRDRTAAAPAPSGKSRRRSSAGRDEKV